MGAPRSHPRSSSRFLRRHSRCAATREARAGKSGGSTLADSDAQGANFPQDRGRSPHLCPGLCVCLLHTSIVLTHPLAKFTLVRGKWGEGDRGRGRSGREEDKEGEGERGRAAESMRETGRKSRETEQDQGSERFAETLPCAPSLNCYAC